jgi:hypothetical protein
MRKALPVTFLAAVALLLAAVLQQTAIAMPLAMGRAAIATPQAPDAAPVQNARLVCGWWWGHFECARICPATYHHHWHRHYRYDCQPVVLGLPWI